VSVKQILLLSILLPLLLCSCAEAHAPYPEQDFPPSTPEAQGMDAGRFVKMIRYIRETRKDVHDIVIVRNGYEVAEAVFFPERSDFMHIVNSCTKSVTSALLGIALGEGMIKSVNDSMLDYFRDRNVDASDKRKRALTIRNLLTMTDGMDWTEEGNYGGEGDSWGLMWKSPDQVDYVLSRPMRDAPGRSFYYNTGASHILSAIIQKASGRTAFEFAREKLFAPLGITEAYWSSDTDGVTIGGAGLYLRPMDLAKFGYLYLRKGKWRDRQVVPARWVEESTARQIETPRGLAGRYGYGYQWWMNGFGGYSARGYRGQYLFVVPALDLVTVFACSLKNSDFFMPETLMELFIVPAAGSDAALDPNPGMDEELGSLLKEISSPPPPSPPGALPETARAINGKTFIRGGSSEVSFTFDKPDEFRMSIRENNRSFAIDVGLDGVYRISDVGANGVFPDRNLVASKGRWTDDNTLVIQRRQIGDDDELEYRYGFDENGLSYSVSSRMSWTILEEGSYSEAALVKTLDDGNGR
jgi:CubicO group peptidase (beta-lactamase class C family)